MGISRSKPKIDGGPVPIDFGKMVSAAERLKTYPSNFKAAHSAATLAEAGFMYVGEKDRVQCPFCKGVVKNWLASDVPIIDHQRYFVRCPFIMGYNVGNIPLGASDPVRGENSILPCYDVVDTQFKITE